MAVPFPYPSENMSGIFDLFVHANTLTGGFLGIGILIVIAVISFISTKAFSTDKSFAFSMFFTLLIAIFLRFMDLITNNVLYICIVLFLISAIWIYLSRNQELV